MQPCILQKESSPKLCGPSSFATSVSCFQVFDISLSKHCKQNTTLDPCWGLRSSPRRILDTRNDYLRTAIASFFLGHRCKDLLQMTTTSPPRDLACYILISLGGVHSKVNAIWRRKRNNPNIPHEEQIDFLHIFCFGEVLSWLVRARERIKKGMLFPATKGFS